MHEGVGEKSNILLKSDSNEKLDGSFYICLKNFGV